MAVPGFGMCWLSQVAHNESQAEVSPGGVQSAPGGCNTGPSHWPLLTQNIVLPVPSCYQTSKAMAIKLVVKSAIQTSCICCLDLVLCTPSCDTPWHGLWFSSSLDALLKDSLDPVLLSILGGCPCDVVTLVLDAVSERRGLK